MAQDDNGPRGPWTAKDWDELIAIWNDLVPDFLETDHQGVKRRFRGKELRHGDHGFVFQRWVVEAFRLSGAECHDPQATYSGREELDGIVFDGWQSFIIESKLCAKKIKIAPISVLSHHVENRPPGVMGLFFAPLGITPPATELTQLYRPLRVLLFEGRDFSWLLERRNMMDLVSEKWKQAVKNGEPNIGVIS